LPTPTLRRASRRGRKAYLDLITLLNAYGLAQLIEGHKLRDLLGWGRTV
jgi:hypothetical protein